MKQESNNDKLKDSYENQHGNIWNDYDSDIYRDGEERDLT